MRILLIRIKQLGECVKRQSARLLGFSINVRQWRHIAIALDRRVLLGIGCHTYGVSQQWGHRQLHTAEDSDSDVEAKGLYLPLDRPNRQSQMVLHSGQAGHTVQTNNAIYGNDLSPGKGLTDTLLAAYENVSREWHRLCGLEGSTATASNQSVASNAKRPLSATAEEGPLSQRSPVQSDLSIRRKLWTWPRIEQCFHQLFGPLAQPRGLQREGLTLIASSRPETLIVMPTGSGKTIFYTLPSIFPQAQVTIVIVPLIALKQDLIRRCEEWKLQFACYETSQDWCNRLYAVFPLIFVDIDIAVSAGFRGFLQSLQRDGRLDRIVIEEVHLILTSIHYREKMGLLGVLREIPCPVVCLTATLPPIALLALKEQLRLTQLQTLRSSCDRPNLEYGVELFGTPSPTGIISNDIDRLARRALVIYDNDIER